MAMNETHQKNIRTGTWILLLAMLVAYANHFTNGFHFDDSHAIVENIFIRDLSNIPDFFWEPKMFSASTDHHGLRPLVTTTLAIDYWLGGGLVPAAFHISTFIWFLVLGVMLFFLYRRLLRYTFDAPWPAYLALITTGWYMLHTANAETINYIISRSDVQSTFCIVASFLIYIAYPEKRKYGLYIVPAFVGVFAKETVPMLVIILFFYILLFEEQHSIPAIFRKGGMKPVWRSIRRVLPLAIVVTATQLYTLSKITGIPGMSNSPVDYIFTQTFVWVRYAYTFFVPIHLSADTDWTVITNLTDIRIIIGIIFVALLFWIMIRTSVKQETKPISLGLIWFCAALLPTSLAPFAEVTNDHRMFFPFIGLAMSVVTYVALLVRRYHLLERKTNRTVLFTLTGLVLVLNTFGVYQRNKVWKNDETLWYDVTIKSPKNGRGLMNYGLSQMARGRYEEALSYFEKARETLPFYHTLYINLGIVTNAMGKPEEAEPHFSTAIQLKPGAFESYMYYARFLNENKRFAEAKQKAETALQLNPNSLTSARELMRACHELSMWTELESTARQALLLLPGDETAVNYLDIAQKRTPPSAAAPTLTAEQYLNLSLDLYNKGQYEACISTCHKALKLKPDYANAYNNIGAAYNMLKQWDNAIEALTKAIELDPAHPNAKANLEWARAEKTKQ